MFKLLCLRKLIFHILSVLSCKNHIITSLLQEVIAWLNDLSENGPVKFQLPAMGKGTFCQTSWLKAPSTLVLNTVSLGNSPQVTTTFILKRFSSHVQQKWIRTVAFCTVTIVLDKMSLCLYHKPNLQELKGHKKDSLRPSLF